MPPDQPSDDEDTREHIEAPSFPAHARSDQPAASPPPDRAPTWSSDSGSQQQQPQQAWQQPPAQQPWQQPSGWQQPPGWYQPGYWQPAARYPNNPLVVVAGIVLIVFGVLVTFVGLIGMLVGAAIGELMAELIPPDVALEFDISAFSTALLVVMGIVLVVGILHLLSAIGIFMHKGWARAVGILLAMLGLLLGVVGTALAMEGGLTGEAGREAATPIVIAVGYGFTLFSLIAGGSHFQPRY